MFAWVAVSVLCSSVFAPSHPGRADDGRRKTGSGGSCSTNIWTAALILRVRTRRMGYSLGRWGGDVLVVETVGFNDKTWLDGSGHPHSEQMRLIGAIQASRCRPHV
jgi:hypothetical protein